MKNIKVFFLICFLNLVFSLACYSQDTYIIIEGPGAGTLLFTETNSSIVPRELNEETQAGGMIGQAEPPGIDPVTGQETGCSKEHYHGILFGENDPRPPTCGWGKVAKIPNTADEAILNNISRLLTEESQAHFDLRTISLLDNEFVLEAISGVSLLITRSLNTLPITRDKIREVSNNQNISRAQTNAVIRKLRCALTADREAARRLNQIESLLNNGVDVSFIEDRQRISRMREFVLRRLQVAIDCKLEALELLQESGLL